MVASGKTATLELSPNQAETLALAQAMGDISLTCAASRRTRRAGTPKATTVPSSPTTPTPFACCATASGRGLMASSDARRKRLLKGMLHDQASQKACRRPDARHRQLTGLSAVGLHDGSLRRLCPNRVAHNDFLKIGFDEPLPASRDVLLGLNKTMIVEVPRDLRDVVVSNPEYVDAVVQSSNRVYLIAKQLGNANVFFFDENGEQILSVDVRIERDMGAFDRLIERLIPGANVKSEVINDTIILTGSVPNPADSRAPATSPPAS